MHDTHEDNDACSDKKHYNKSFIPTEAENNISEYFK
jgi:hypothetical protein